jgi:predicted AAA+ superfamily ATPase
MNFDERLDKLAERHEALTQTVELIAAMQRDLTRDVHQLNVAVRQDAENIRALARIAEIHDHRLTDLEGGES